MKHLETLIYLNPNKIENSLFNEFLKSDFKIYSYDDIEQLSEYIIEDLNCDLILIAEEVMENSKFDDLFKGNKKLVIMSKTLHDTIVTLKMPIDGLELKDKLIEVYESLK